jgi:hypothetical protein
MQTQKERERESCGDNGVLKSAIECAVGFGAHLRFLFLCNSLPFFRVWCFAVAALVLPIAVVASSSTNKD